MSDIFREVEEDVRREQVRESFWKAYGIYAIAALVRAGVRWASPAGKSMSARKPRHSAPRSPSQFHRRPAHLQRQPGRGRRLSSIMARTAPKGYAERGAASPRPAPWSTSGQQNERHRALQGHRLPMTIAARSAWWRGCAPPGRWPRRLQPHRAGRPIEAPGSARQCLARECPGNAWPMPTIARMDSEVGAEPNMHASGR